MTNKVSITVISQTLKDCLNDPGIVINKLHRSDGITQNLIINQLFANFYRTEPYEYITNTPHNNALTSIEQYFATNKNAFEAHIQEHSIEELMKHTDCGNICIGQILNVISDNVQEYGIAIRESIEEDEEIIERVSMEYNAYMNFMVIMEDKLPSLSEIIKSIPSDTYLNSLWKFLYRRFMEYLICPLENKLREVLVDGVKKLRINAINKAINGMEMDKFSFASLDTVSRLHEVSLLLANKELNERSVYFIDSTVYISDGALEQMMKAQTIELYQSFYMKSATTLTADLEVLQDVLMPNMVVKLIEHSMTLVGNVCDFQRECILERYEYKDAEVELNAKQLGIA